MAINQNINKQRGLIVHVQNIKWANEWCQPFCWLPQTLCREQTPQVHQDKQRKNKCELRCNLCVLCCFVRESCPILLVYFSFGFFIVMIFLLTWKKGKILAHLFPKNSCIGQLNPYETTGNPAHVANYRNFIAMFWSSTIFKHEFSSDLPGTADGK